MTRPLLLSLVFALALPSFAAVGPSIPLSTPTTQPAANGRGGPRIASNGDGFLAVWYDDLGAGIRAARLDRNGALIDERSFLVAGATGRHVAVASDGANFVVAYDCTAGRIARTCLARVLAGSGEVETGAVVDGAVNAAIASNGRGYLLVFQNDPLRENALTHPLDAVEVSPDAQTVGRPIHLPGGAFDRPEVASDGEQYFVVWSSYAQLSGVLVSATGEVGAPQQLTRTIASWGASAFGWSVASNGRGFLVVWQQNVGVADRDYVTELRTCPISADGIAGAERTIVVDPERTSFPSVAWSGSAYEVSYTRAAASLWPFYFRPPAANIHRVRVNAEGQLVGGPESVIDRPGRQLLSATASNGSVTVVVWERELRGAVEIEATRLGSDAPFIISNGVAWQQALAGAMSGETALVAWEEFVGPVQRREVVLQRLSSAATPLDGRGIAGEPSANDQLLPAVTPLFVAWLEQPVDGSADGVAVARRLASDGTPIGPLLRLGAAARNGRVAVATARTQTLFAWPLPANGGIAGVRVTNGGTVLDLEPFAISQPGTQQNPTVATDGADFLVAWQQPEQLCLFECIPPNSLHAARVTAQRAVGAAIDLAPADASRAEIVWNGREYVVFWSGVTWDASDGNALHVRARVVDRQGVLSPAAPRLIANGVLRGAQWTGEQYVVAFDGTAGSLAWIDRDWMSIRLQSTGARFGAAVALLPRADRSLIAAYPAIGSDGTSRATARIVDDGPTIRRRPTTAP